MAERKILYRGLIEVSNQCAKDCRYCGIRRGNRGLARYHLTVDEVLACADEALRRGYPAIALQAGELETEANTVFYETVLRRLHEVEAAHPNADGALPRLEVTLSLGEQTEAVYRRWKEAAEGRVLRYLLRIESSTPAIYARLHPADCSFERRVECIRTLKRLGYVTGSGVLIGVPGQTKEDLLRDADFFEAMKLDMVGMGPYVPHPASPLEGELASAEERLQLAVWMIREVRRRMPNINMVAATALEALAPGRGRDFGIAAGANVVMPDLTPEKCRVAYDLYPGKASST
jgi:biotin synthase